MGTLTQTDVGEKVKAMNAVYQPDGRCSSVADRPHMQALIERLRNYTDQVQSEADRLGLVDDENVAQWALDMAHWRERLAGYQQALDVAVKTAGEASCEEIYGSVVGPLLDGNFAAAVNTSGIVNPEVPSPPDIATPYMLGNQVVTYREFQAQNFDALIGYFIDEAKNLAKKAGKIAKRSAPSVLAIGAGLALGALALGYLSGQVQKKVTRE
jgi:hypothetical protein